MTFARFTIPEILDQLDRCAQAYTFPMLDNGYVYPGAVNLTAYSDIARWAIIIEVIGVNNRVFGYERFDTCLYCFGNCLPEAPGIQSSRFLSPVPEQDDIFDEEGWFVRAEAKYMIVRDTTVAIPKDEALYRAKGITLERAGKVSIVELLRVLIPEYRTLFTATVNELQAHIPQDIPQMLQLAEWRHPDIIEEKPSETVTFRDIAAVLVTGDPKKYTNTSAPNTHWSFWPMGGAS